MWLLFILEGNVKLKIFGPVRIAHDFRTQKNKEMYDLLNDMDVVQRINIQRLRRFKHVGRMEEDVSAEQIFDAGIKASKEPKRGNYFIARYF